MPEVHKCWTQREQKWFLQNTEPGEGPPRASQTAPAEGVSTSDRGAAWGRHSGPQWTSACGRHRGAPGPVHLFTSQTSIWPPARAGNGGALKGTPPLLLPPAGMSGGSTRHCGPQRRPWAGQRNCWRAGRHRSIPPRDALQPGPHPRTPGVKKKTVRGPASRGDRTKGPEEGSTAASLPPPTGGQQ